MTILGLFYDDLDRWSAQTKRSPSSSSWPVRLVVAKKSQTTSWQKIA